MICVYFFKEMEIFKKLLVVIAIFCILHKDGIFAENIKLEDEKNDDTKNHENKKSKY